jgi:hypothetical protein
LLFTQVLPVVPGLQSGGRQQASPEFGRHFLASAQAVVLSGHRHWFSAPPPQT